MGFRDLTGQVFGRLTALSQTDRRQGKNIIWLCRCVCGNEHDVAGAMLTKGHTRSCGCLKVEADAVRLLTHGATRRGQPTITYKAWLAMRSRCNYPKNKHFRLYGGRGISVCDRWNDYEAFLADMGPRPSEAHSLERIDGNGNYAPGNVEWATSREQNRNTSRTRLITIGGRTLCLTDWLEVTGLSRTAVYLRIAKGWSDERALMAPSRKRR